MKFSRGAGRRARPVVGLAGIVVAACVHAGPGAATSPDGSEFPAPRRPVASSLLETVGDERRRDQDAEAAQVIDALLLVPGMRVADIGAGTGYYTVRLAARLGPASVIYAQETDPAALAQLGARTNRERLLNVVPIQGYPADPGLPPGSIDVALLGHIYHRIPNPYAFLHRLAGALAPAGRVAVIAFDRGSVQYGLAPALVECEFAAVGYRRVGFRMLTPGEAYLAVFEPPDRLPAPSAIVPCGAAGTGQD